MQNIKKCNGSKTIGLGGLFQRDHLWLIVTLYSLIRNGSSSKHVLSVQSTCQNLGIFSTYIYFSYAISRLIGGIDENIQ